MRVLAAASPLVTVDVRSFGARGDNQADDTAAVQQAIEYVYRRGGGVVRFSPGIYLVGSVNIYPGIAYVGERAVIRRPDIRSAFAPPTGARTFTTQPVRYSGLADSPPLIVKNLTFDGNVDNQGSKKETEQAHLLFLSARTATPGRLKAIVEDCVFRNSPADGITVYTNVDGVIMNCAAHNCRRTGLTMNGGYSRVQVSHFRCTRGTYAPRIDMEIASPGYGGTQAVDVVMDDVYCEGNFELEVNGGEVLASNLRLAGSRFSLVGRGIGTARFVNCDIGVGGRGRVHSPGRVTFEGCRFRGRRDEANAPPESGIALNILWNPGGRRIENQVVRVADCDFVVDPDTEPGGEKLTAISTNKDQLSFGNRLVVEGGSISADYDVGLRMERGGRWVIKETVIQSPLPLRLRSSIGFPMDVLLDGAVIEGRPTLLAFKGEGKSVDYPPKKN